MIVSIFGLGYIGLPTAALIANKGIEVIGIDINEKVINTINEGKLHIVEPDLDLLVKNSVYSGKLKAMKKPVKADIFLIAVPTPFVEDYKPDLSYIELAIKTISPLLEKGNIVILESTSPVGTTEKIVSLMQSERPDLSFPKLGNNGNFVDISVAYCPERVLPGQIIHELVKNDRIIGGVTTSCAEKAADFYKIFVESKCMITDCRTAELGKLVENSYRDVNIAFANELSLICNKLNVDVWDLIKLTNHHPRVNVLKPGPGVGGHCIAVDPWFIIDSAPDETKLIKAARSVNDNQPKYILKLIKRAIDYQSNDPSDIVVTCLGVSYKANIDDLRSSPALEIVSALCKLNLKKINIVEPNISSLPKDIDLSITQLTTLNEGIKVSDIIIVLVDHDEFFDIDKNLLKGKKIIDTRGILSLDEKSLNLSF